MSNFPKKSVKRKLAVASARLGLLVGSLLILLTIAELAMRVCGVQPRTVTVLTSFYRPDAATGWSGRPDVNMRFATAEYDVMVSHDPDGLRKCGLESKIESDSHFKGEVTWCVGDSFTWGHGVADEAAWVTLLNEQDSSSVRYRNLGVGGYSALQEYLLVKRMIEQGYIPDRVAVLYSSNDPLDNLDDRGSKPYYAWADGELEVRNYPAETSTAWNVRAWLKRNALVYNYLSYYVIRAKFNMKKTKILPSDGRPGSVQQWTEPHMAAMRRAYSDMKQLCESHGVELCVVKHNVCADLDALCEELSIPLIDIEPYFQRHATFSDEAVTFQHDGHWTELGNKIAAGAIKQELGRLRTAQAGLSKKGLR